MGEDAARAAEQALGLDHLGQPVQLADTLRWPLATRVRSVLAALRMRLICLACT